MPIPEEEEEIDEDTEGLSSNNPGASLSQNQEQGLSEAQKHSDPIDATIKFPTFYHMYITILYIYLDRLE